jgi:hypothetical protein
MAGSASPIAALVCALALMDSAQAFRTCDIDNSGAYAASTQYIVGELAFDEMTGLANGTETTYNYSNRSFEGFTECHVTYELSGSYDAGSQAFFIDANRTNHSPACPAKLIDFEYPDYRMFTLQVMLGDDGVSELRTDERAGFLATGTWRNGRTAYKTAEKCTLF